MTNEITKAQFIKNCNIDTKSLSQEQINQVQDLLYKHRNIFSDELVTPGFTMAAPYKTANKHNDIIKMEIEKMLEKGIISPSKSPWSAPVVLVKKKDGTIRFCVDYRKLNEITERDSYPIPNINETLDYLSNNLYFSALDMTSGYWQIPVKEEDKQKTAFITKYGLFEFNVMPFGLKNAPATFQRTMDTVLSGLTWISCLVYIDDVIIYSKTYEKHLKISQV